MTPPIRSASLRFIAVVLGASLGAPLAAGHGIPLIADGAPPAQGGCDAVGLTCAAGVTLAGHICIDQVLEANTDINGKVLFIIPVSATAHTEVHIKGCMGYAAGGSIGVSNDFPSEIDWSIMASTEGGAPADYVATYVGDFCTTGVGLGQFCADFAANTVAKDTPPCMKATVQVHTWGSLGGTVTQVPGVGPVYAGFANAEAHFENACSQELLTVSVSSLSNMEGAQGDGGAPVHVNADQFEDPARLRLEELAGEAWREDMLAQVSGMKLSNDERPLVDALARTLVDRVSAEVKLEDLSLSIPPTV